MANSSLNLTSLDFDTLKTNFKTYLKSQSVLKDYDFEGSNINVLLDVMSYNSYLNSFYLNMIASEMFLDSAQNLNSVISHAKELNYVPQSKRSSTAFVNFTIDCVGISGSFKIPKGTTFFGRNSNGEFKFVTSENNTYFSQNSTFSVSNLAIYDGSYFTDTYIVDYDIENQIFTLSNEFIDINSLTITVTENNNNTVFKKVTSLHGLDRYSNVYFLQPAQDKKYEIVFGDAFLGRRPDNRAVVTAEYRIVSGPEADGISSFDLAPDLGPINGGVASIGEIISTVSVTGGNEEDIETIRYRAPRYFAAQQRAISNDDYSSLILSKFGGEIENVIVYGGQEMEPKQYGRVIVCVKPYGTTIAPDYLKASIVDYLKEYIALPNRVIITDPDYFYLSVDSIIQFDSNLTTKYATDIKTEVTAAILQFSKNNIEKFGNDFRFSKLVAYIDNVDSSITSNQTTVKLTKRITPLLNFPSSFMIKFGNEIELEGVYDNKVFTDERVLRSTNFTYVDDFGRTYPQSYMEDVPSSDLSRIGKEGDIKIYTYINNVLTVINENIGYINYSTGTVSIKNLITSDYGNYISLSLVTKKTDILASQNIILMIDNKDIKIDTIQTLR